MEVIQLLGYTEDEKVKIATRYLIPRQREAHGLKAKQITIHHRRHAPHHPGYTREAGLRNLEREIATICRGVAAGIAEGKIKKAAVKVDDVALNIWGRSSCRPKPRPA
jgi:ATP-dependent Lon protease